MTSEKNSPQNATSTEAETPSGRASPSRPAHDIPKCLEQHAESEPFNPHRYGVKTVPPGFLEAVHAARMADRARAEFARLQERAALGVDSRPAVELPSVETAPLELSSRTASAAEKTTMPAVPHLLRAGGSHIRDMRLARYGARALLLVPKALFVLAGLWAGLIAIALLTRRFEEPVRYDSGTPAASAATAQRPEVTTEPTSPAVSVTPPEPAPERSAATPRGPMPRRTRARNQLRAPAASVAVEAADPPPVKGSLRNTPLPF